MQYDRKQGTQGGTWGEKGGKERERGKVGKGGRKG
jgi:hypothetical protein